jgi:hypothetical protein
MQPREAFFHDCLSWISLSKNKQMIASLSNAPSIVAMTLAILISPADAKKKSSQKKYAKKNAATTQAQTTCTSTSPECCWVVESWKKMGGTTSVSSTSATACCRYVVSSTRKTTTQTSGIPGVNCTSTGIVTKINWWDLGLVNSIPAELGSLTSLTHL